ncbi:MAG: hypothetical protein ABFD97_16660 [Syntrophobacter sp.]
MKIIMRDGHSVEVPYYWMTAGQYRFTIPGGIAGIPSSQVASVQEIIESKEFDPEILLQRAGESTTADERKLLQDIISSKAPEARCQMANPEEGIQRLRALAPAEMNADKPRIHGQKFNVQKSVPVVCDEPGGPVLVIQQLVSGSVDPKDRDFSIILYDSEGNVVSRKACDIYPLALDQESQNKLQVKGKAYLVRASIKPDARIKRYEIASVQR